MIAKRIWYDAYPAAIAFLALLGNARLYDFDVFLWIGIPFVVLYIVLTKRTMQYPPQLFIVASFVVCVVLYGLSLKVSPIYTETYYLWAVKVFVLSTIMSVVPPGKVSRFSVWIVFLFTLFLIAAGNIEGGRLVSLFGPNILYRCFGVLLVFSLLIGRQDRSPPVERFLFVLTSLFGLLATGSTGALLMLVPPLMLSTVSKKSKRALFLLLAAFVSIWLFFADQISQSAAVTRAIYKQASFESSVRYQGWVDMLFSEFSALGHTYRDGFGIWSYGFAYPHNILIELYYFFGIVGGIVALAVVAVHIRTFRSINSGAVVSLVILLGSLVSGELGDNLFPIAFSFYYIISYKNRLSAARRGRSAPARSGDRSSRYLHKNRKKQVKHTN